MHNYYAHLYNKVVFEAIKSKSGPDSAALFARSATAGGQRYPVHWGGDCGSTFTAMAESIRGGLSLMSSGFAFWSHDIGGFEGLPAEELYCRWVAFGLFSSHVSKNCWFTG
jgi:alpha-D-xyloside xylohydrolase